MRFLILFAIFFVSFLSYGQKTPSAELVQAFFQSKTYIVYEDNIFSAYNIYVKDAAEKDWTITPYSIISYKDFETKRKEANASFLVVSYAQFTGDRTNTTYNFLNLLLGGKYRSLTEMPDLVNIPLSISDQGEDTYVHKLAVLMRFVQNHMLMLQAQPGLCDKEFDGLYKQVREGVEERTIYFLQNELNDDVNSLKEIAKVYPYPVKLCSTEEIEELVSSKKSKGLILHIVGPDTPGGNRTCLKVLLGTDDAEVYFYDSHRVTIKNPSCFLKKDFEKIAL
jgi:sulfite reductase alpha subunit-like flavoprotein